MLDASTPGMTVRTPSRSSLTSGSASRSAYQIVIGLVAAVALPGLYGPKFFSDAPGPIDTSAQDTTTLITLFSVLLGYVLYRRVAFYPGVNSKLLVIPTFAMVYLMVLVIILFARLDFSRVQFGLSFLFCIAAYYVMVVQAARNRRLSIGVVPGSGINDLLVEPTIDWVTLDEPMLGQKPLDGVVVDLRSTLDPKWERMITDCAMQGVPVFHVKQLRESLTGKVMIEHLSENNLGNLLPNLAFMAFKRVFDIFLVIFLAPVLLPLFVLTALAIKLDDGGPVFFTQMRMGYQARPFRVFKFRTMAVATQEKDPLDAAKTRTADPRITRVGRVLRQTRIDELPQIFNILSGSMSWIGPRPEALELSQWYEKDLPFYRYRFVVRPGITGWAQVSQGHVTDLDEVGEKLKFDFYYIKNFSPWLDFLILLRTFRTIVLGEGAR